MKMHSVTEPRQDERRNPTTCEDMKIKTEVVTQG